jgi:hypothetical protein
MWLLGLVGGGVILLGPAGAADREVPPKKLLLVGQGPDGHPPQSHEYMAGLRVLAKCLRRAPGVEVTVVRADGAWKDGPELLARADGVVLYLAEGAKWAGADPKRKAALRQVAARKGGLATLHWAMGAREAASVADFVRLFGGCHGGPDRKYKVLETEAHALAHPVTAGVKDFRVRDEFYYRLKFVKPEGSAKPLLRVTIEGKPERGSGPTAAARSASAACTSTTTGGSNPTAGWWRKVCCGRWGCRCRRRACRWR